MPAPKPTTATDIKRRISELTDVYRFLNEPRVAALIQTICAERKPELDKLKAQLAELQSKRKVAKRWPDDTPEAVMKVCQDYWIGTTEYQSFRIHMWNDKAVWTSYPSGGYSTVGGWSKTPRSYVLVSRTEREGAHRINGQPKRLKELCFAYNSGQRVTPTMMKEALAAL